MSAAANKTAYGAGHFGLELDGNPSTAFIKSLEGGFAKAIVASDPIGPDNTYIKHTSVREIDPVSIEVGLAGCRDVMRWIRDSWQKEPSRRSGQIIHADFNMVQRLEHEFTDALIVETTFPTLDGASKEPGYLKVKFLPEAVKLRRSSGGKLQSVASSKQKAWTASAFRLIIDGIDTSKVSKIDGFSIKQGVKPLYIGRQLYPELEPTKVEFPDLSVHMSLEYAEPIMEWYEKFVRAGEKDTKAERTGAIEFLAPNRERVLFRINLYEVGLKSFSINRVEGRQEAIKRCKFELYVGQMDLDPMSGMA
jgi:hypothetical protein